MKKLITIFAVIIITASVFAQAPEKMSYQAVIRDNSDALVSNASVGMRISILQGSASGTAVYVETQTPSTNVNGLVSVEVGAGNVVSGNFSTIEWANGQYFIKTETDPNGGTNYSITGTSQLLSVPYAMYAKSAGTVSGGANETDPVFGASVASGITGADTTNWNNKQNQLVAGSNISITGNTISVTGSGCFIHYIGEEFGGGVIFHLWKDALGVEHGLIIDKTDISTYQRWSNIDAILIGSSAQSSWDGLSNSNAIVSQAGHTNSASVLCLNSTNGGQSDWYLPSIDELSLLWYSRFNVNKSLSTIGGATVLSARYWSSTEVDTYFALFFTFGVVGSASGVVGGFASEDTKDFSKSVRAVRAF